MDFGANKTPIEIIKEGAFGVTWYRDRDIHSGVIINGKKVMEKNWLNKEYWPKLILLKLLWR